MAKIKTGIRNLSRLLNQDSHKDLSSRGTWVKIVTLNLND